MKLTWNMERFQLIRMSMTLLITAMIDDCCLAELKHRTVPGPNSSWSKMSQYPTELFIQALFNISVEQCQNMKYPTMGCHSGQSYHEEVAGD